MSGDITARDRVWAAIINIHSPAFDVDDIRQKMPPDHYDDSVPSDETIKRVLRAATEMGILRHTSGSPYWKKKSKHRERFPAR